MQIAEKYRLPKITLTDEAKDILRNYKWPGNVRQLKNITEQISVLSKDRLIDTDTLKLFIPQDKESMQLAPISGGGAHSYESEREILYKILYELRGNVSDLRRDMNGLRKQLDEARSLNVAQGFVNVGGNRLDSPASIVQDHHAINSRYPTAEEVEAEEINDMESLNLSDLGRQMVEKALERNGGNRKKAAQELGISDRTLYRRIKQYGLEKN